MSAQPTKDGGPAAPCKVHAGWGTSDHPGMSLRDYFAAQALTRCVSFDRNRGLVGTPEEAARLAYQIADAMLAAREGGAR